MDERFGFNEGEHVDSVSEIYRQYAEKSELENKLDEMMREEAESFEVEPHEEQAIEEKIEESEKKQEESNEKVVTDELANEIADELNKNEKEKDDESVNEVPNSNSKNLVTFKGCNKGLEIYINNDPEVKFDDIVKDLEKRLDNIKYVYNDIRCGIVLKGRKLSKQEEQKIVTTLRKNMYISIDYINTDDFYFDGVIKTDDPKKDYAHTMYYHGTLRSGQSLECDSSLVIFGDVNPGSEVVAGGNLIVMGSLRGVVQAGQRSNDAYIVAFDMNPKQLRIGDHIARAADDGDDERIKKPHKAYIEDDQICIEPIEGTFNLIEKEC